MSTIWPASRPFCFGTLMMPRMRLRVVWGLGEMMASFSPTSAFSSVLLPALGRPRMQTNPECTDIWDRVLAFAADFLALSSRFSVLSKITILSTDAYLLLHH